ncbi:MAG: hypothetical protein LV481_04260 [Methylacidiphilales bacterium]|nr:hypothetical protein [Candidatus Methylacidiphilales bacterium]
MQSTKIFQPTWALQQLPVTMKLTNMEWRFLICSDGRATVHQIQRRLALSDKERDFILNRLCASGLLTERVVTLDEFAQATVDIPSTQGEPRTFTEYLQSTESAPSHQEKSMPAFSPLPKPSASQPAARTMSLQSVIQFILNQHPDPTAGHLATYQVFMGISTQLLKRNGITSLRFQDDRLITDPELQTAIAENIQRVLKVPCPEEVFSQTPPPANK